MRRIGVIATSLDERLADRVDGLADTHDVEVFVDHASAALGPLAERGVPIRVAVKSYLSLGGGVLSADAGQAKALASIHADKPFDELHYDPRRCADLGWHDAALARIPVRLLAEPEPADTREPWAFPWSLQRSGFVHAATADVDIGLLGDLPVQTIETASPMSGAHDGWGRVVQHAPGHEAVAAQMSSLLGQPRVGLLLGGRYRDPLGDADASRLCHHVVGLTRAAARLVSDRPLRTDTSPAELFGQAVRHGVGVLVVPVPAHGCDARSFDVPPPPASVAAKEWVMSVRPHLRAALGLPSRGGLLERGLYEAGAPAGVIAWARQQPWAVRRLAARPRPPMAAMETLW